MTSANVVWMKRAPKTKMAMLDPFSVSSDLLRELAYQANLMNIELLRFSRLLSERGPPPPEAHKL